MGVFQEELDRVCDEKFARIGRDFREAARIDLVHWLATGERLPDDELLRRVREGEAHAVPVEGAAAVSVREAS